MKKCLPLKRALHAALLVLLLSVLGMVKGFAQYFTVGDLNYSFNDDGVSVTVTGHVDGIHASGELLIPETIECFGNNYLVTAIGDWAFENCEGLVGDLVIPNTVLTIGNGSFQDCYGFGSLTIGNSVVRIESQAFCCCSNLSGDLVIPNSVTEIGSSAFQGCTHFNGSLTIGQSVRTIGERAFLLCLSLTGDLVIPDSVTEIGDYAFDQCLGFNGSLIIGSAVVSIGEGAFKAACHYINRVVSGALTPPALGYMPFMGLSCTTLIVPCGCISAYEASAWHDCFPNIVEDCTTVSEDDEIAIAIYPNPTSGNVRIEASSLRHVTIFNTLGQQVYDGQADGDVFECDLSCHEPGVYFIRMETASGITTKRVVLTR